MQIEIMHKDARMNIYRLNIKFLTDKTNHILKDYAR